MTQATIRFSLGLIPRPSGVGEASAWFIVGEDPQQWLREMIAWGVSLENVKLHVIAGSAQDRRACGVLVAGMLGTPRAVAALSYAKLGERLFFPADGHLSPRVTAEEVDAALPMPVYVLHPSAGLVGFAHSDVLSIADLMTPPIQRDTNWNCAEAGVHIRARLETIEVDLPPPIEAILEAGKDDIGSAEFDDVPFVEGESPRRDAVSAAMRRLMRPILEALSRRGKSTKPGARDGWLRRRLKKMAAASEEYRHREIRRLLALLSQDPDKGLQFALPLHALITRGKSEPTNLLKQHSTDFNLSKLMGGNLAGDNWNLPADMQRDLRAKYLASANRELNLGRFHRAAYIFAHLLGDYASAADALKRGRYYRDAAVIYKERLNNAKMAANCLVEGGLLGEAIVIYKELRLDELAGDLHTRLGQVEEAHDCYVSAAAQLAERKDFLAAAKIWETKLASPETAIELLEKTWPEEDASGAALREWFAIVGRMGLHDLARERIKKLCGEPLPARSGLTLIEILSKTARDYPNPAVRFRAVDATRVMVGHRLTDGHAPEHAALVKALTSLAPGDHLLRRDGARSLEPAKLKPATRSIPLKEDGPRLLYHFHLPAQCTQWQSVIRIAGGALAVGNYDDQIILARRSWDKGTVTQQTIQFFRSNPYPLLLIPPGSKAPALLTEISARSVSSLPTFNLGRTALFEDDLLVVTPPYMTGALLGACRDENDNVWILKGTGPGDVALVAHGDGGKVLASYLPKLTPEDVLTPVVGMAARGNCVYIALEAALIQIRDGRSAERFTLPGSIRSLTVSPPLTATRLLATMDEGVAVVWHDGEYQVIGQKVISPVATFTPEGFIVIASDGGGGIYKSAGSKVEFIANFHLSPGHPIAVLPASRGEFAVFYSDGRGDILRIS